jgi:hypothetical protein
MLEEFIADFMQYGGQLNGLTLDGGQFLMTNQDFLHTHQWGSYTNGNSSLRNTLNGI